MIDFIGQFNESGWLVVDIAWKSTVILLLVHALDWLWLNRRPIAADTVWSATMLVLALLPLACLALPRFAVPMPMSFVPRDDVPTQIASTERLPQERTDQLSGHDGNLRIEQTPMTVSASHGTIAAPRVDVYQENSSIRIQALLLPIIAVVYAVGLALAGLRLGAAHLLVLQLRRNATKVPVGPWTAALQECKQRLNIRRDVELLQSPDVAAPLTVGWRHPAVILPVSSVRETDEATMNVVVLHELTHVARGDYQQHLVAKAVQCVYWYNPLMWLASGRLKQTREAVCDGFCVSSLGNREAYVQVLFEFAQRLAERRQVELGVTMIRVSKLERRIARLVSLDRFNAGVVVRGISSFAAVAITVLLGAATVAQDTDHTDVTRQPQLSTKNNSSGETTMLRRISS